MKTRSSVGLDFRLALGMFLYICVAHSQTFRFNNLGGNGGARAPVYGPEASDPYQRRWGNTATATPTGTQTYSGPLLAGTNYAVEAWYSLTPVENLYALNPGATPVENSLTFFLSGANAGYFAGGDRNIPDANPTGSIPPFSVYLQIRAWETGGGQYSTWDAAYNAAQAGGGNAIGWSKVFEQPLTVGAVPYPGLINFESFNIAVVPEPSLSALALLGGAILFAGARIFRRRLP
jgi:hypothetical protein